MGGSRPGRRGIMTALLGVAAIALSAQVPAGDNPDYDEALRLFRAGDWGGAAARFEELSAATPEWSWGHYYVGACRYRLGDLAAADERLARAAALAPDVFEPHYLLGRVRLARGEPASAAGELESAMRLATTPDRHRTASRDLAEAYVAAKRWSDARALLASRLEEFGPETRTLYLLGLTLQVLGEHEAALERLRAARSLATADAEIARRTSVLSSYLASRAAAGDVRTAAWTGALEDAEAWLASAPRDDAARTAVAEASFRLGRYDAAVRAAGPAAEGEGASCDVVLLVARALNRLRRVEPALAWSGRAVATCGETEPGPHAEIARAELNAVRELLDATTVQPVESRARAALTAAAAAIAREATLDPGGTAEALGREAEALGAALDQRLAQERAALVRIENDADRRRCEELRARLWRIRTADTTGEQVDPLTAEEKAFLRDACGVRP